MKFIAHIPTEQYGFIELELEVDEGKFTTLLPEVVDEYFRIRDEFNKKRKDREPPPFDIQNPPINKHLKH